MEKNWFVPTPINFNCWKHHAGFIAHRIKMIKSIETLDELKFYLLKIGESQMDLYFGKHSPEKITKQIIDSLNRKKAFSSEQFQNWLAREEKNYQLVELKDRSVWTLRLGEEPERYVHIHPGRYSLHTVRVKATTLKTAIMILCFRHAGEIKSIETETVNFIRMKYLNEPPIKSFSNASGLGRIINLLSKKL
jgi:hypothetical protein